MSELKLFYKNVEPKINIDFEKGSSALNALIEKFNALPLTNITNIDQLKEFHYSDKGMKEILVQYIPSGQSFAGLDLTPFQILDILKLDTSFINEWRKEIWKKGIGGSIEIALSLGKFENNVVVKDNTKYSEYVDDMSYLKLKDVGQIKFYEDWVEIVNLIEDFQNNYYEGSDDFVNARIRDFFFEEGGGLQGKPYVSVNERKFKEQLHRRFK